MTHMSFQPASDLTPLAALCRMRPHWHGLASAAVGKLLGYPAAKQSGTENLTASDLDELDAFLACLDDDPQIEGMAHEATRQTSTGASGTEEPALARRDADDPLRRDEEETKPCRISFRQVLALLRLVEAMGTPEGVAALGKEGALTIFEIQDTDFIDPTAKALKTLWAVAQKMGAPHAQGHVEHDMPNVVQYHRGSSAARERLLCDICKLLDAREPGIALIPRIADLPPSLAEKRSIQHRLPPLSLAQLPYLLRALFGIPLSVAESRVDEQRAQLEPVARLTFDQVSFALRMSSPEEALDELSKACSTRSPRGTLDCLRGMGRFEQSAQQVVNDLLDLSSGKIEWSDMAHSMLLHGAPGTGKTFGAEVIAEAAGVPLIKGSLADWQAAGHLGQTLAALHESFAQAIAAAPCVFLIDELDAFGSRDERSDGNVGYRRQVINAFLLELNALQTARGIFVIGATNDITKIDPAILRPGRFDMAIELGLPGPTAVAQMVEHYVGTDLSEADRTDVARRVRGLTPAAIDAGIRRAKSAARREGSRLTREHVLEAIGIDARKPRDLERRIALHEMGHALVAMALRTANVTAVRLLEHGGVTEVILHANAALPRDIDNRLAHLLGGRAAERLVLGSVSAGSGGSRNSDLGQATELAFQADFTMGLGLNGVVWTPPDLSLLHRDFKLLARLRKRIDTAENRAMTILSHLRETLEEGAERLMEERVLLAEDLRVYAVSVRQIFSGAQVEATSPTMAHA